MNGTLKSLCYGAVGGLAFFLLDLPLAWMMGSMCLTTVLALRGMTLQVHDGLRKVMTAVLGVMLGSSFSPGLFQNLSVWQNGLALLTLNVVLSMIVIYWYYRKIGGFDPITAYFSSAPGGFNVMYEVGEAKGGDGRAIALIHATRILFLVMTVPLAFRYGADIQSGASELDLIGNWGDLEGYLWLSLAAVVGYVGGGLIRLPASHLMGPLAVAAIFEITGITSAKPPMLIVYAAQLVIGTAIGLRFLGTTWHEIRHIIVLSLGSTVVMMLLAVLLSYFATSFVGVSIPGLILALSPGGLAEMSLVALALGIDVAFVSIMHVIRITAIISIVPLAYPTVSKLWDRQKPDPS
ncbi:AbrB family transcriptional regulator [Sneathiella chinensis]|uniref:Monooxygenase n=1 Tax=Sneathiella chinensis TaxID=349750 RepID=A0ABQ5U8X4_9PROT|nr:AbrB family transcriptional regulator [Sneathiella chinensis]GLQ07704.1 monooxygenase [Sneathiella chinensis]